MILIMTAAFFGAQSVTPASTLFDRPIGEVMGNPTDEPLERLSLDQLSRFAALPPARIAEMKCAGLTGWAGAKDMSSLALDDTQRKAFFDTVATIVAKDTEIDADTVAGLIHSYADEPDYRKQQGEWPAYKAEIDGDCAPMIAAVKAGSFQPSTAPSAAVPSK